MTSVLALDCSTTAAKAVAFDPDGRAIATARARLSRSSPQPGWGEQHAENWWKAASTALLEVTRQLGLLGLEPPQSISITHQRETFVCLDAHGVEVRPGILWLDTRAHKQIAEFGSPEVHAISGKPASTTPSIYKLLWLKENEPEAWARTAMVLDVGGYLISRLTGQYATSTASADPLSLVDMASFTWSPELLELTGLSEAQLPALCAPGSVVAGVSAVAAAATGLPEGLPVIAGAGDGQSGGLGAAVVAPGEAYLSLGTSLTLGVHSEAFRTSMAYRVLSSPIAGSYTLEGLVASGALSLAWFRQQVAQLEDTPSADASLGELAATIEPGARGLLFLPYLTSAETPYWDAAARGAFVGLGDYHGIGDMIRSVFEGLALEVRLLLEAIEADTGQRIERLTSMGGLTQSETLMQIFADVLQRDILVAAETETVALGAGILAAYGVQLEGQTSIAAIAKRMTGVASSYSPQPEFADVYDRLFAVYTTLYPSLKTAFASLANFR
ncbi:MAG: carbohydrate kinase, family protein [Microbacteriaceae bacterium]|jgi:xylulokinase|nr:carbohydrate kinase, family protein [Microbacteriaceae bacterium]